MLSNGGFVSCPGLLAIQTASMIGGMELPAKNVDEPDGIVELGSAASNVVGTGGGARLARPVASQPGCPSRRLRARRRGRHREDDTLAPRGRARGGGLLPRGVVQPVRVGDATLFHGRSAICLNPSSPKQRLRSRSHSVRALAVALLLEEGDGPPPDPRAVAFAFLGAIRALHPTDP